MKTTVTPSLAQAPKKKLVLSPEVKVSPTCSDFMRKVYTFYSNYLISNPCPQTPERLMSIIRSASEEVEYNLKLAGLNFYPSKLIINSYETSGGQMAVICGYGLKSPSTYDLMFKFPRK